MATPDPNFREPASEQADATATAGQCQTPVPREFNRREVRVVEHNPLHTPEPVRVTVTR